MSFFKFSKFSKFLSTCFAFSFLFSGSQTYSMNLDMLNIGIRNNLGGDNESAATKSTVASPLDGIEFKIPEKCEFCDGKVARSVLSDEKCGNFFICKNNRCLEECFKKFLNANGLKSIKLDVKNIHRCSYFQQFMQYLKMYQQSNDASVNEDELLDVLFLPCGHSICACMGCTQKRFTERNLEVSCPRCNVAGDITEIGFMRVTSPTDFFRSVGDKGNFIDCSRKTHAKIKYLINERLNSSWKDRVIFLSDSHGININNYLAALFLSKNSVANLSFEEDIFNEVDDALGFGTKILVVDVESWSMSFLKISNLENYIRSLITFGKYKRIIYPVEGKLHDKIEAIAIKFMEDNTTTVPKKLYDEICSKMLKDDVE